VAFPPNYNQDRKNRDRAKQQKALEKQQKREDKSAQRKKEHDPVDSEVLSPSAEPES
jgi:hypothetical protein